MAHLLAAALIIKNTFVSVQHLFWFNIIKVDNFHDGREKMNLTELLRMRGFDLNNKTKLVRHQDKKFDVQKLYKTGYLDFYQGTQGKDVFGNCNFILSFIGDENKKATFIGAYKKVSSQIYHPGLVPIGYPINSEDSKFYYEFEKIPLLEDLIDRLVIDWGKSTRMWCQWLSEEKEKQVIEILPKGYIKEFPGYDELNISYEELRSIIKNPDANRIWHTMLSSVAGVYMIVDMLTGFQYVGSAYGENGILGRWQTYVDTFHGGNQILINILHDNPKRYQDFQFSILQTLPRSMNRDQVIRKEQVYKLKLGSRAFGLNIN